MMAPVTGGQTLLRKGGIFRVAKLYSLRGALFAGHAGGYVRLYENGATSVEGLHVTELHIEEALTRDRLGRLRIDGEGTPTTADSLTDGGAL